MQNYKANLKGFVKYLEEYLNKTREQQLTKIELDAMEEPFQWGFDYYLVYM